MDEQIETAARAEAWAAFTAPGQYVSTREADAFGYGWQAGWQAAQPETDDRGALAAIIGNRVGWGQAGLALLEDLEAAGFARKTSDPAWQAAQHRTVSAEQWAALIKACEPWTTFKGEDGYPSSTTFTAEGIASRALAALRLTVAEAGEVR